LIEFFTDSNREPYARMNWVEWRGIAFPMTKFVFVTGGVVSSIGKGIVAASLGRLLKSRDYSIRAP
jgi:hypothetical protein